MSDRRPENLELTDLRVLTDLGGFEPDDRYVRPGTRPATLADLLAAVRRGVESGTIKGEVVWRCFRAGGLTCRPGKPFHEGQSSGCGYRIIIPVSDGGSET